MLPPVPSASRDDPDNQGACRGSASNPRKASSAKSHILTPHLITKLMRRGDYRVTLRYYMSGTTQLDAGQIREILGSVTRSVSVSGSHCFWVTLLT